MHKILVLGGSFGGPGGSKPIVYANRPVVYAIWSVVYAIRGRSVRDLVRSVRNSAFSVRDSGPQCPEPHICSFFEKSLKIVEKQQKQLESVELVSVFFVRDESGR